MAPQKHWMSKVLNRIDLSDLECRNVWSGKISEDRTEL